MMMESKSFSSLRTHMNLWEVAHQWSQIDPNDYVFEIPLKVKSILNVMMLAQLDSKLWVSESSGHVVKDWSYILAEDFIPYSDMNWDGSDSHKRTLYVEYMIKVTKEHDDMTSKHYDMIYENKPYEIDHLKSIYVHKENLAEWSQDNQLPFPDFWFTDIEKKDFLQERNNNLKLKNYFQSLKDQGTSIDDILDNVDDIDEFLESILEKINKEELENFKSKNNQETEQSEIKNKINNEDSNSKITKGVLAKINYLKENHSEKIGSKLEMNSITFWEKILHKECPELFQIRDPGTYRHFFCHARKHGVDIQFKPVPK